MNFVGTTLATILTTFGLSLGVVGLSTATAYSVEATAGADDQFVLQQPEGADEDTACSAINGGSNASLTGSTQLAEVGNPGVSSLRKAALIGGGTMVAGIALMVGLKRRENKGS